MPGEVLLIIILALIAFLIIAGAAIYSSIHNTRLRIKHGYPLENMWGMPIKPAITTEATERVRLLTQENAQLRAEMGALHDRLANVERIVTDSGYRLGHEIERLRDSGRDGQERRL